MKLSFVTIAAGSDRTVDTQVAEYLRRTTRFAPVDEIALKSEKEFVERVERERRDGAVLVILLDSRGKLLTSEEFAAELGQARDGGKRRALLAIGPPDGWSPATLKLAGMTLSLGRMTLPHQLARLVLAEQVYRAFTILAGHPYHSGH
ncbi:23S rRNA (pseudouridine(1915)-N(3))-methyltransferase RlmH [Terriglobus tenax]|uniref:23S rRNA (pseudouridine(1915)-N(3))-methyltransferase RlmH n=1 Tax=Terriglobus tenax TaxID=1111115 RepID=UPI0021DF5D8A|nr:23S rRNA (pseudouridine(1915)-N(3))-methyltransferase RlmH [Terriglobus tenax]